MKRPLPAALRRSQAAQAACLCVARFNRSAAAPF